MKLSSAEQLEVMIWELVELEWRGYQNRLEIRIANVLRNKSDLPQMVVVNIAKSVSKELAEALTRMAWRTGAVRDELNRILS